VDACAVAMAKLGDRSMVRIFKFALLRKDADARKQASYYIGEIGEKSAIADVRSLLGHWNKEVRAEAAVALGKLGDREAVKVIKGMLKDKDAIVRLSACDALGLIGDTTAHAALMDVYENDDNGLVRLHAVESLMRLGDCSCVNFLLKSLDSYDSDAQAKATKIAAEYGTLELLGELEKLYTEERNQLRVINMAGAMIRIIDRRTTIKEFGKGEKK